MKLAKFGGEYIKPLQAVTAALDLKGDITDPNRLKEREKEWNEAGLLGKAWMALDPYQLGSVVGTKINKGINKTTSFFTGGKNKSLGGWLYDVLHSDEQQEKIKPTPKKPKVSVIPEKPKIETKVTEKKTTEINKDLLIIQHDVKFNKIMLNYLTAKNNKDELSLEICRNQLEVYYPQHKPEEWFKLWSKWKKSIINKLTTTTVSKKKDVAEELDEAEKKELKENEKMSNLAVKKTQQNFSFLSFSKELIKKGTNFFNKYSPVSSIISAGKYVANKIRTVVGHTDYKVDNTIPNALKDPKLLQIIEGISNKYGVDSALVKAVIEQESRGKADARSPVGALGLMQLMPSTARWLGVKDPLDPVQNVEGGTKYLSRLLKQFGNNIPLALAAYNAGPGNVKKYGGIPPFAETQKYVVQVPKRMEKYRQQALSTQQVAFQKEAPTGLPNVDKTGLPTKVDVAAAKEAITPPSPTTTEPQTTGGVQVASVTPQEPVVVPIPVGGEQPLTKRESAKENTQPIDSELEKLANNIFNNSSFTFEDSVKNYALLSSVNY